MSLPGARGKGAGNRQLLLNGYRFSIWEDENMGKIAGKLPNTWKLNYTLLSNPRVKKEVSRKVKRNYIELNEYNVQQSKFCGEQLKQG